METTTGEGLNGIIKVYAGPMGAGKTLKLLHKLHKYDNSARHLALGVKSAKDPRPPRGFIGSRAEGMRRPALVVPRLGDLAVELERNDRPEFSGFTLDRITVVGIDELMFFDDVEDTRSAVIQLAEMGKIILASSLDVAGNGRTFPVIRMMQELKAEFKPQKAECAICGSMKAMHTCIYENQGEDARPFARETLDFYVPDDGTLGYKALCRVCYRREDLREDSVPFTPEIAATLRGHE